MKRLTLGIIVGCLVLVGCYISTPPIPVSTHVHTVHVSFDDVSECMADITNDSDRYRTLADHPFFAELDRLHAEYGAKFSLYLYYRNGQYTVEHVTNRYKIDFQNRSGWLKFGFHAVQPGFDTLRDGCVDTLRLYFEKTSQAVSRFADTACITRRLRLNRFFANSKQMSLLDSLGVKGLMGADDDRRSYSLPDSSCEQLWKTGHAMYGAIEVLRTDIRLEKMVVPENALRHHADQDTLAVFTHEREFGMAGRWKMRRLFELLKANQPKYIN